MARYIDLDKVFPNGAFYVNSDNLGASLTELLNRIGNAPIADVVEVKHGKWIYFYDTKGIKRCKCSECITSYGCLDTPYCPNCGAKMDKNDFKEN